MSMLSLAKRNGHRMKTTYIDPLIPLDETRDETLTRLSANIGTLTGLMDNSERMGHYALAALFDRARDAKVAQSEGIIARVTAGNAWSRRMTGGSSSCAILPASGGVPLPPRRKAARSPVPLALTP